MHKLTLSFKDRILKIVQPKADEIVIGRNQDCDLQIDNLAVNPVHTRIRFEGENALIQDEEEDNHTLLNGKPVSGTMSLKNGDRLVIGKHEVLYTWDPHLVSLSEATEQEEAAPGTTSAGKSGKNGWLQFMNGPKLGRTMKLDKNYLRIGKSGKAGAVIASREDGYYITHLEGDMPVKVGERVIGDERTLLKNGDTIEIADMKMLFFTQ